MAIVQGFFAPIAPEQCSRCKGYQGCKHPYIEYSGKGKKEILIIGGWPSLSEDRSNSFYSGESGKLLRQEMRLLGYNLDTDFWYTKGVSCYSASVPSKTIIKNCRHRVCDTIQKLKPKAIIVFGNVGIDALLGGHVQTTSAEALSGLKIPLHRENCWALPMMAPEICLGGNRNENLRGYFKRTLKKGLNFCKDIPELKKLNYLDKIELLTDADEIIKRIQQVTEENGVSACDIETTGLNPYDEENGKRHTILTMSITTENASFAFPLGHPEWDGSYDDFNYVWDAVAYYLESPCKKIAHRTEFENKWFKILEEIDVEDWYWCTKTTQHIVDNRMGTTGLKHQAFVRWGIKDFNKSAEKYIKSKKNTIFNTMDKMPLSEQLLYVGIDSYLTFELYKEQKKELKSLDTQTFFNDVVNMFNKMSINGICTDLSFYDNEKEKLEKSIKDIYKDLFASEEIKTYEEKYGAISFTSPNDMRKLFFKHLKCVSESKTNTGQQSVDKTAIEKTGHWIADKLILIRKLMKIKDTYIAQFVRETRNGKIHPSFNVFVARSLRSSSQSPNFQNIPKRDELSKYITRSGLKPSPGNRLIELDFSGAEVITSASYHKDPNFINYVSDPKADMHRDCAADLWKTSPDNISKKVRFYAKNCWTFPQFYGDYFGSCAKALWENKKEILEDGKTCLQHLIALKINTFKKFTEHCKKAESIMWGERFKVYDQWRKDAQIKYRKNYTVSTYFGFIFKGYLDWKQVCNYPIQGTSFHLLLKVLLKMDKWLKRERMETKLIGQIHDSGFFDSPDNEYRAVIKQFQKYTDMLYDEYMWLEVPMEADADISLIDGNFTEMFAFDWDTPIEQLEAIAIKKWSKLKESLFEGSK